MVGAAERGPGELLSALRDRIAEAINDPRCSARDLAPLIRRLQEIAKEIETIDQWAKQEAAGVAAESPPVSGFLGANTLGD